MRVVFFASDKPRELSVASNMIAGIRKNKFIRPHRDKAEIRRLSANNNLSDCDVAFMVGVKSKRLFEQCVDQGITPVMMDKGYIRSRAEGSRVWEYWRVSVGAHHPTKIMAWQTEPSDRWDSLGVKLEPWKKKGSHILLAGSSAKYHNFYNLPDPTEWAQGVVDQIREYSDLPIIYRPKPSWKEAVPIAGTSFTENRAITQDLENAHCMITHGSNACFEALTMGIPCIVLGDGVGRLISRDTVAGVNDLIRPEREQFFANLAYYQWTEKEMMAGHAWAFMRELI